MFGGDPSLKINQVGISKDICKILTKPMIVNSLNYGLAEKLIREKKVNHIQKGEQKFSLKFHNPEIDLGDILQVHLMKGYWMVINRQPTLHQPSMIGFRLVLEDIKTFKVSFALTKTFNSDFDGDDINCHVPQNLVATTEVKELIETHFNILSPKNDMPIICIVQDGVVSRFNEIVSKLGYIGKTLFLSCYQDSCGTKRQRYG